MIEYIRDIKIIDDEETIETPAIWELPDCAEYGLCGSVCCCAESIEEMGECPPGLNTRKADPRPPPTERPSSGMPYKPDKRWIKRYNERSSWSCPSWEEPDHPEYAGDCRDCVKRKAGEK